MVMLGPVGHQKGPPPAPPESRNPLVPPPPVPAPLAERITWWTLFGFTVGWVLSLPLWFF